MSDNVAPVQKIILPGNLEAFRPKYAPKVLAQCRVFNFGQVKSGKTGIAASCPEGFIIDEEDKTCIVAPKWMHALGTYVPRSLQQLDAIFDWLLDQRKKYGASFPVKTVFLDTMDGIQSSLIIPGMTEERMKPAEIEAGLDITDFGSGGGKGSKGWNMVTKRVLGRLAELYQAGYGWWVNGHCKEERQTLKVNGQLQEIVKVRPAVNPGLYLGLKRAAEIISMTSLRTTEIEGPTRTVMVNGSPREVPGPRVLETVCVLSLREKQGDSDATGSNLTLPHEIILRQGRQWQDLNEAYSAAVAATQTAPDVG